MVSIASALRQKLSWLSFHNQYQSTGIQQMTDLPTFASVSEVCEWINEEATSKNSYNYAVLLPVIGFVGFVNLIVSKHAAFFAICGVARHSHG